ncbi:conserved hypothetical protein [Mycobacterium marinum E11]|nr:conserved hypothetical protein [Mycobacterium marinum E11]
MKQVSALVVGDNPIGNRNPRHRPQVVVVDLVEQPTREDGSAYDGCP